VLVVSPRLIRLFGKRGTQALERLMGLILILISVQMFLDGIALNKS
jgi:multiple antibiotic resistance protein